MKYSSNKDLQAYIATLVATKKWTFKQKRRGRHAALQHSNGGKLPIPGTPGDYRALMNFRAGVRQIARRE